MLVNIETEYEFLEPALQKLANILNIQYLNLGPALRDAIRSEIPLQIENDSHWSPICHKIVAEEIYQYLCGGNFKFNCKE